MTQEDRQSILKNALVKKTQKDPDWAREIEESVHRELAAVLATWDMAAEHEHIGPKEAISYLKQLAEKIGEASCYLED